MTKVSKQAELEALGLSYELDDDFNIKVFHTGVRGLKKQVNVNYIKRLNKFREPYYYAAYCFLDGSRRICVSAKRVNFIFAHGSIGDDEMIVSVNGNDRDVNPGNLKAIKAKI